MGEVISERDEIGDDFENESVRSYRYTGHPKILVTVFKLFLHKNFPYTLHIVLYKFVTTTITTRKQIFLVF